MASFSAAARYKQKQINVKKTLVVLSLKPKVKCSLWLNHSTDTVNHMSLIALFPLYHPYLGQELNKYFNNLSLQCNQTRCLTQNGNSPRFKHEAFFPGPGFHYDTVGWWVQLVVDAISLAEGHCWSEMKKPILWPGNQKELMTEDQIRGIPSQTQHLQFNCY